MKCLNLKDSLVRDVVDTIGEIEAAKVFDTFSETDTPTYKQVMDRYQEMILNRVNPTDNNTTEPLFVIDDPTILMQLEGKGMKQRTITERLMYLKSAIHNDGKFYIYYDKNKKKVLLDRVSSVMNKDPKYKFDNNNFDENKYEVNREWGNQSDALLSFYIETLDVQDTIDKYNEWVKDRSGDLLSDEAKLQLITNYIDLIDEANKRGAVILTQIPFWNLEKKVAGTTDVILVLPDGSLEIRDLKTSNKTTEKDYDVVASDGNVYVNNYRKGFKDKASKAERHQFQQSMYKALATSMGFVVNGLFIDPYLVTETDGIVTSIAKEKSIPVTTLNTVMEEYAIDNIGGVIPIFENYRSEFSEIVDKIKKLMLERIAKAPTNKEKNRLSYLYDQFDFYGDKIELVSKFIDDTYNLVYGVTDTLPNGNTFFRKGLMDKINDIDKTDPEQAIKQIMQIKQDLHLYRPMMEEIQNLYTIILQEQYADFNSVDQDSTLNKLKSLSLAITALNNKAKRELNPLLAKQLYKLSDNDIANNPEIQAQEKKFELRLKSAVTDKAKEKIQKEYKAFKESVTMSEDDLLQLLEEGQFEDINVIDTNLGVASMSGNAIIGLYAKAVKRAYAEVNQTLRKEGFKAAQILEETIGRVSDPAKAYEGLFKKISYFRGLDEEGNYIYEEDYGLISEYDYDLFNKSLQTEIERLNAKYPNFKTSKTEATSRNNEINNWYTVNTVSLPTQDIQIDGVTIIEGTESIRKSIEDQVASGFMTKNAGQRALERIFDANGNIRSDNWVARGLRLPASRFKDPNYANLNGQKKKLYDYLVSTYVQDQKPFMERRNTAEKFRLPYIPKQAVDQFGAYIKEQGVAKGMVASTNRWFKENFKVELDREYDFFRDQHKSIPQLHSRRIPITDVSLDLVSSILLFKKASETYKIQEKLLPMSEALYESVESLETYSRNIIGEIFTSKATFRVNKDTSNTAKMLREYIDRLVYGETKDSKNPELNKIASSIMGFVAFTGLGGPFGVVANVANWAQGTAMTFVESHAKQYFTPLEWSKSQGRVKKYLFGGGMIKDSLNPVKRSLYGQLIDAYDAVQGEFRNEFGQKIAQTNLKKHFNRDKWFLLQNLGEYEIQLTTFDSMLHNTIVKDNQGNDVKLIDAYELDSNGLLKIKDSIDKSSMGNLLGDTVSESMMGKLHYINKDMHGVYNTIDQPAIKKYWYGSLLLFYRNWFVPGFKRRYKRAGYSQESGEYSEGMYRTFFKALIFETKTMAEAGFGWKETDAYTPMERANMRKTLVEMSMILTTMLMAAILKGLADASDDDEKQKWLTVAVFNKRLQMELSQYINPIDAFRTMSSPSFTLNTVNNVFRLVESLGGDLFSYIDDRDIQRYKQKSGFWEKGDSKSLAKLARIFGVSPSKSILNPDEVLGALELKR